MATRALLAAFGLTILVSSGASSSPPPENRIVLRRNFGVLMERVAVFEQGNSQYMQVFAVEYPNFTLPLPLLRLFECRQTHTKWYPTCLRANKVLSRLNFERQSALDSTKSALASAREIIPYRYDQLGLANRRKRALLTFVGRVFKFLFGTVDDTEAKKNHDTMHILMKRQQLTTREVEKLAANFNRIDKTTHVSLTEFSQDFDKIAQTIKHINRNMIDMGGKV